MSTARESVLGAIRAALKDVPGAERSEDVVVERRYRTRDDGPRSEIIALFVERVAEYKAIVRRTSRDGLAAEIAAACSARGVKTLVAPHDLPGDWLPPGLTVLRDPGLTNAQLEGADGVLTGCALGIAQTGTVVLDCGPGQGRRAVTLVPDYHLCVVFEDQVVGLVPEGVAKLRDAAGSVGRPLTFISGPSATSDIELNRVEGVHGPRTLEVIVVA